MVIDRNAVRNAGRIAVAVAAVALAPLVGCTNNTPSIGVPESPQSQRASPALASPQATSPPMSPAASASLPALRLPRTTASRAGEYGWEGAPGGRAGMHRVISEGNRGREATAMLFAVGADCLSASPEQQVQVRVAGFDGVSVEPYDRPVTFIGPIGDETTRAYALAVADRTLCVYLTWHATTTADELEAAAEILDTLRAEPIGEDRIRIVFTLEDGWDTG